MNFDAEVKIVWALYPSLDPAFRWKTIEARVDFNCVKTLFTVPLKRGGLSFIPKIAVARSANPNFIHKDQPGYQLVCLDQKKNILHEELRIT